MSLFYKASAGLVSILVLNACNSQSTTRQQVAVQEPSRSRLVSDPNFRLPEGTGCSGVINRFRALIDNDLDVGHTTKSVHSDMSVDIERASAACSSSNDAGARSLISASRSRHGYPAL